ncbi:immunoglobulin lambda-1 light chain-like [Parambassis ranga]|uniref:immunoglobulin lambda-1 light chain-like n=1 Tax=Parambassis ranga TaxID=210632 RepID=UPI0010427343|nr:immunoglobulin lambda-1 light chain-like [Parambassis ranga]
MLLLPAAALCCLCSALVAMETELVQETVSVTRRVGDRVPLRCTGADRCDTSVMYWYQNTHAFSALLRFDFVSRKSANFMHPLKDSFSTVWQVHGMDLMINNLIAAHSAVYYCACWKGLHSDRELPAGSNDTRSFLIFGPGTKLYVTDEQVVQPVLSVYPAASSLHPEGSSSLLCLASAMFPPLVRFSWRRQKENGLLEELPPAEGEQLELRESGLSASIRVLDRDALRSHKYSCYVEHEGGRVEAHTQQGQAAAAAVHGADSEESAVLLWTLSAEDPHQPGLGPDGRWPLLKTRFFSTRKHHDRLSQSAGSSNCALIKSDQYFTECLNPDQ